MVAVAAVLGGFGCGDSDPTPAARDVAAPARGVAGVVERLERAVKARDFKTICNSLLTPTARERAGAAKCPATMAESSAGLRRPRIRLLSVQLTGNRARARLRSSATGQAPLEETLLLQRTPDGYRIAALGR